MGAFFSNVFCVSGILRRVLKVMIIGKYGLTKICAGEAYRILIGMDLSKKATCIGLLAPVFWGSTVGLVRDITREFNLASGLAIFYGITVLYTLVILGVPKVKNMPLKYLFFGIPLANLCALLFCLSMYLCEGEQQTVEVGMVNYMWPCLVVFLSIFINNQKTRWWVYPGMAVSFLGITIVLGGDRGVDAAAVARNVSGNPAPYILAFLGALAWGLFSNLTKRWQIKENPTVLIFAVDFLVFAALWACGCGGIENATATGWISVVLGAVAIGSGYAAWNYGVAYGNMTLLAIASYFTPVLSCVFAALWIGSRLGVSLLAGVAILIAGSLLCWSSAKFAADSKPNASK